MSKINAYINFKGNCREAMTFYQSCLGGELNLQVVKESPMAAMFPPEFQDGILHASLEGGELTLLGSDMPDDAIGNDGGPVSLMLICAGKAELHATVAKLGANGKIVHPVETFYAGTMGNLIDKFGIRWGLFTDEK
jgi:PhnB protein